MYNIIVFENKRFGNIRTFVEEGKQEPWFVAADVYNTEQETVMYLEYREDYEGYAIVTDLETDGSKILLEFSGIGGGGKQNEKDYGSLWRCWRRKPTKNERENTSWEDEGR